mgnify:CR=1 FL=1
MNKVFSMIGPIGICPPPRSRYAIPSTRAGKTVAGEFSVEKAVKDNKAKVVIVSTESSDNTKKLFENKCKFYKIPVFIYGTKAELGMATGNKERASIAVLDPGFSKSIVKMLTENE